MYKFIR